MIDKAEVKFDLHMHSTYSDGIFDVKDLIERCKTRRLKLIAISDHDTTDHIKPAIEYGKKVGIHVIPAIELSTTHNKKSLHLLGYGIDSQNKKLNNELTRQQNARIDRIKKMIAKLHDIGWHIDNSKEIFNKYGSIGRPLLAKIVFENNKNKDRCKKENINNFSEFLDKYLTPGAPAWVDRYRTTMELGIELIHKAGGIAVWAHPMWSTRKTPEILELTLTQLISFGLDGIEVFYGVHTREETKKLYNLANKNNLIISAGSDFHSPDRPNFPDVGGWKNYGINWSLDDKLVYCANTKIS